MEYDACLGLRRLKCNFYYFEYLRKFEVKFGSVPKPVWTYAEPIYAKIEKTGSLKFPVKPGF
jgi:hypothetical protein